MYETYFNLSEEPFRLTPDPKYLYLSKRHLEVLSCLHYGIQKKKGFIEITGEIGAGKTTLCRTFISQLQPTVKYALIFNPALSETQMLEAIVEDLGIEGKRKTKKEYFDLINNYLLKENAEGNTVLVIVDEAHRIKNRKSTG